MIKKKDKNKNRKGISIRRKEILKKEKMKHTVFRRRQGGGYERKEKVKDRKKEEETKMD